MNDDLRQGEREGGERWTKRERERERKKWTDGRNERAANIEIVRQNKRHNMEMSRDRGREWKDGSGQGLTSTEYQKRGKSRGERI